MFYKSDIVTSVLCHICMKKPETLIYFIHIYLQQSLQDLIIISPITPQSAIFGFTQLEAIF